MAPPRPPKSQQPRVHQLPPHHQQSSSSLHHRPRAPEPLPHKNNMSSSSSSSDQQQPPPPRPPTQHPTQEPVLPLPPRVPKQQQQQHLLKPTVLHAANITTAPSHSPVVVLQGTTPPTIAPLVPLQHQTQQQQQSSITFGRRSRASPVQQQQQPSSSNSLSSATIQPRSGSSPSPNRTFNPIGGVQQQTSAPIISSLTRNISTLSSNLISNLVSHSSSSSSSPGAAPADTVTLAVPRPENERLTNEYVDTPFLQQQQQSRGGGGAVQTLLQQHQHSTTTPQLSLRHGHHHHSPLTTTTSINSSRTNGAVVTSQPTAGSHGPTARLLSGDSAAINAASPHAARKQLLLGRHASNASQVITKQPTTKDLKDAAALHSIDKLDRAELSAHLIDGGVMGSALTPGGAGGHTMSSSAGLGVNGLPSITCPQCEKCRCEGCQKPRQLPSRWLCGKSCLCSAESVLDYATCLCCVKALFYHCSKDHEIDNENGNSISCADDPCSCLPHRRTTRWGCLGALSLCLPCLVCYWPMRGAISMCAACYASQSRKGCRCNGGKGRQQLQMQQQLFGRDGPMDGGSIGRGGGGHGNGGSGMMIPGAAKKVFPVDHHHNHHQEALNRKKLGDGVVVVGQQQRVDCDRAEEQDRLTIGGSAGVQSGVVVGVLSGGGAVDSDSSSSCGGGGGSNLVRTLRLKPTSTSSTSSSQLSLLRHPADETPPRHLLD